MDIVARFKRLTFWNKVGVIGAIASIAALALTMYTSSPPSPSKSVTSNNAVTATSKDQGIAVAANAGSTVSVNTDQRKIGVAFEEPKPIEYLVESGQVKVAQITIDSRKCFYIQHLWRPGLPVYNDRVSGTSVVKDGEITQSIRAFGKVFSSDKERDEYEPVYRANTNWLIFQAVEAFGYPSGSIVRAFDIDTDRDRSKPIPQEQKWPVLLASISNNSGQPIVVGNCTLNVLHAGALKAFDRSESLEPKARVTLRIYPKAGHYSSAIAPPLKIAPKDSASIEVQLIPASPAETYFGYLLACELVFAVDDASITSEKFLLRFNGRAP